VTSGPLRRRWHPVSLDCLLIDDFNLPQQKGLLMMPHEYYEIQDQIIDLHHIAEMLWDFHLDEQARELQHAADRMRNLAEKLRSLN
jgi:hypothetical protein